MGIRKEKRKNMNCCPECGSKSIVCTKEEDKFLYGKGKDEVELSLSVDIWTCDECCSSWIGCDSMEKRDKVVKEYLKKKVGGNVNS